MCIHCCCCCWWCCCWCWSRYKSPRLADVQEAVRRELTARGARATLVVFWGRHRYVSILWHYIKRNLAVNGGIVSLARHSLFSYA
jgi:hypothetical protein